jgi:hypothetical protein
MKLDLVSAVAQFLACSLANLILPIHDHGKRARVPARAQLQAFCGTQIAMAALSDFPAKNTRGPRISPSVTACARP